MNQIYLSGRLAADAEGKGKSVTFPLCVRTGKDQEGNDTVIYVKIRVYKCQILQDLRKGTPVMLSGRLNIYRYEDSYFTEVIANGWELAIIPSPRREDHGEEPRRDATRQRKEMARSPEEYWEQEGYGEDYPRPKRKTGRDYSK